MSRLLLIVKGPRYYSLGDEMTFFNWCKSIAAVETIGGSGQDVHIQLKRQPSDRDLRELVGLFFRYNINMKPLVALRTKRNAKWFSENPDAFWHKKVFGSANAD